MVSTWHFLGFIIRPEKAANPSRTGIRFGPETCGDDKKSNISSANIHILCVMPPTSMPVIVWFILMYWAMGSSKRANKRRDNGQPCRVPLSILKASDLYPAYFCRLWVYYTML